jgi:hypothetical protein
MGERKHKFREVFKALKTNVSRKNISDCFYVGLPVLFASIN